MATLAVAVSNTDAFQIHRTSAPTTSSRGRSPPSTSPVGGNGFVSGSFRANTLKMSSKGNNEVIIGKDFRLSAIFLGGGLFLDKIPFLQVIIGPVVTVRLVSDHCRWIL